MTVHTRSVDDIPMSLTTALGWLAAIAAAATLVFAPASANAEEGAAPIVYGQSTSRGQVARTEFPALQNAAAPATIAALRTPAAETLPPLADAGRELAPRNRNDVDAFASAGAIDLRPGAPRVQPASFGPAPKIAPRTAVSPVARAPIDEAARTLAPQLVPATQYAEPVAGAPYQVEGRWYVPMHEPNYDEVGVASWYGPTFHGKAAANGEIFDEMAMTAAHPTLPLPSLVRVTNLENGKSVVVRLNDRGPFVDDRIIDLSKGVAHALDMQRQGTAKVRVQYVGPAPKEHNVAPVQVALRDDDAAAFQARPLASVTPAAPAPDARATDTRAMEPRLPVADPVEARPRVSAPQANGQGDFMLQAGSFADLGNAHKLRDQLSAIGPVTVRAAQVNGSEFYRVMIGPWASRADAAQAQALAAQAGAKALIVSR